MLMVSKINLYYINLCDELIDYIYMCHYEDEARVLLYKLIDIRSQLRFKPADDSLLSEFWRYHDATYRI